MVDLVVLGAGPVGENLAQYATQGTDLTAVLVERELVGGECSFYACMPSKALLRPVDVVDTAQHLGGVAGARLDVAGTLARRDAWVRDYDDASQVQWAAGVGIEVVRGEGRISGIRTVTVATPDGTRTLRARHAVALATGSEPVVPEMYAACLPWGSRDATGVVEVPERLAIIGGGVVAVEAATWMAALGSQVTMVVRDDRLLRQVEPFAGELVLASLRRAGVDVRLGTTVLGADRSDVADRGLGRVHGGRVRLTLAGGEEVVADELLVAVGRRPRLGDVGLASVGLTPGDVLRGDLPDWLVAVGDASGEPALTHWGKYRARVRGPELAARATGALPPKPPPEDVPVPQVVFTDPQVASVGMTQAQAEAALPGARAVQVPWTSAAGAALLRDDAEGAAQLVVDDVARVVVGATFVGPEAGELLHAATIAIVGQVPVDLLRHAVPSYPTASELWLRLLEKLDEEDRS